MRIQDLEYHLINDNGILFKLDDDKLQFVFRELKKELKAFYELQDRIQPYRRNKSVQENNGYLGDETIKLYIKTLDGAKQVNYGNIAIKKGTYKQKVKRKTGFDKTNFVNLYSSKTIEKYNLIIFFNPSMYLNNKFDTEAQELLNQDRDRFIQYLNAIKTSGELYFLSEQKK
jgi:hypothetical protein